MVAVSANHTMERTGAVERNLVRSCMDNSPDKDREVQEAELT